MVVGLESWREALSLTQNLKLLKREVTMEASFQSWVRKFTADEDIVHIFLSQMQRRYGEAHLIKFFIYLFSSNCWNMNNSEV